MTHLEIALQFAELGYHVFPLYKTKSVARQKPYGWSKNTTDPSNADKVIAASNDPEFIKTWPELVKQKYGSTVSSFGILGLDCIIIDVDAKGEKDGISQFLKAQTLHNIPKPNMYSTTKTGGLHVFYQRPPNFKDSHIKTIAGISIAGVKFDAIDLRGNGGFVVGPDELVTEMSQEMGRYKMKGLRPISELPLFPVSILTEWTRASMSGDLDNILFGAEDLEQDYKAKIRRGIIPESIPKGGRNEAFWLFANVSKSKGVPREACLQMMMQMAKVVEEPETFFESVNLDDILNRAYVIHSENPYDIAVDLLSHGLFQLTNYKSKLHYVLLEDNPYVTSRSAHDESTMKTLLAKYQKTVQSSDGKGKLVNPMEIIIRLIGDENRADTIGFKPGAGQVFTMNEDTSARRYLNTHKPLLIPKTPDGLDLSIWDEFTLIVSRIFGPQGSEEYQLGLDFIAHLIQKPEVKPSISPFILSHHRGVGKSLFFNTVIHILGTSKDGERQGRLTKLDEIQGRFFNPAGCVLNLIDEVQFPVHRDARKESVTFWRHLKNLITAETVSVEIKGGATYQVPNSAALMLAGNTGSHFPIEEMDRRLWIIDANPPQLERGLVDRLFMIVKGLGLGPDDRLRLIHTLRYQLSHHKIEHDLSALRAPATDVKRDMFMNSLTDTEEWFINHFENNDNLFAATPVISSSAFIYVASTTDQLLNSRWREDLHGLFRDFKRRGMLRPIRCKGNGNQSRNIAYPIVGPDGTMFENPRREVLYTTREHGSFDETENKDIIHAYIRNAHTIKHFKGKIKSHATKEIYKEVEGSN